MAKDIIVDVLVDTESPIVEASLVAEQPVIGVQVANKAGGIDNVAHDDTLVGNGNKEPLGVNTEVIATKEDLEQIDVAVKHDDTLVGDGSEGDPLGVNPAIMSTLEEHQSIIPATATPTNKLADKGFVNSSIQTSTAHFRGNWDTWADVPSEAELYPVDAHGNHAPTPNDYLVVVDDEQGGTWRYKYTGDWATQGKDGWVAEYQINETPLTAAQLAALNSGITEQVVASIAEKQDKLTAGENITIEDGVISAAGSGDTLPDQANNAGKLLTTDGSTASWSDLWFCKGAAYSGDSPAGFSFTPFSKRLPNLKSSIILGGSQYGQTTTSKCVTALGINASAGDYSVSIGYYSSSAAVNSIQINASGGAIQNKDANTFKVANANGNFEIMSADGTIPADRMSATAGTTGQVLTKTDAGMEWQDATGSSSSLDQTSVPQLASVDVLQIKTPEEAKERDQQYGSWMGLYSDIVVTLNLNKQEIVDRMYDLYLTVSRFKTNRNLTYDVDGEGKNYRNIPKFSVMNDLRQKTNIRAYCWRMIYDDSLPETHPGRYAYFYTQDLYTSEQACLEYAHDIGLWGNYGSVACGPATCLNAIGWTNGYSANDYLHDYGDTTVGIERYEEGDISEFANVADTGTYPEYKLKDLLTKRECRRYTRDGENYFFWCSNWDDSSAEIYNLTDDNDNPIPNGIPKHMDQLRYVWNVFDLPSTFEFVDKRPDLNYKAVSDPYGFFEALQNLTFKGKYVDGDGRPTYWNCYWFDFPIMPVLLKDCEVRVMSGATKEDYSASVNVGEWHTLEYLANNGFLRALHDDKPIEIKLPYNTYYLWMRFCSLQKRCAYGDYSNWLDDDGRNIDNPMWPEQKLNLAEGVRDYNVLGRRAFARPRQSYRYGEYGKISEYIQFNVCSPMDAASGTKSKATPIQKKLTIDKNATTTIRD